MEFSKLLEVRASTRKYLDTLPGEEQIRKVIEAGLRAPSGRNMQAPIIIAVTDKEIRDKLSRANAAVFGVETDPFYSAPAVLVVLARKSARTYVYDGSLVLGHMMLAAHDIGLGSCWIHRAREVMAMPEWQEWLRSLGIEEEVEGVGNLILGYPDGDFPEPKAVSDGRVYYVR
jgi:nitroreductase